VRPPGPLPRMTCRACGKDTAASTRIADRLTERQHTCPHGEVCSGPSIHGCKQCAATREGGYTTPAAPPAPRWRRLCRAAGKWPLNQGGVAHTVLRGGVPLSAVCGQHLDTLSGPPWEAAPANMKDCGNCARMRESDSAHGETLNAEGGGS
jgi:hypothetical protein